MRILTHSLRTYHRSSTACRESSTFPHDLNQSIKSVLICGPSGVGKGTLINKLLANYPSTCGLSVSHTSRPARAGEINGTHYHFTTRQLFEEDISSGPFRYIETAEVHGNLYGTREDAIYAVHNHGKICILDLDTKGAEKLRSLGFPMHSVFIRPPSTADLEKRLRGRGTEKEEQIQLRVANAVKEMEYGLTTGHFEFVLLNDELDKAYSELVTQCKLWFPSYFK